MGYRDSSTHDSRNGGIFAAGSRAAEVDSAHTVTPSLPDSADTNGRSIGAWFLLALVSFYRIFLSHFFGGACKFHPSCSKYAQEAIARHGARRGVVLALKRLGRCRPFSKGGFDPVPDREGAKTSGIGVPFSTKVATIDSSEIFKLPFTENTLGKQGEERTL
jgi:uncharacterized protein